MVCVVLSFHIGDLLCKQVSKLYQQLSYFYQAHASYHVFESILNGSDHQALVCNFLLSKEACGWGAGWTRSPRGTPERGSPGEGTLGRWGEVVIDRLFAQARGGQQVRSAEDLHHLLKVQGNVVMEKAGGHYSGPRAGVAIKQRPVVEC